MFSGNNGNIECKAKALMIQDIHYIYRQDLEGFSLSRKFIRLISPTSVFSMKDRNDFMIAKDVLSSKLSRLKDRTYFMTTCINIYLI